MYKVVKRDGSVTEFNLDKITHAISRAFEASSNDYTDDVIHLLALRVTSDFQSKIENGQIDVEDIQDSVEKVLSETGYSEVSKAYILYRKQRETIRNINATSLDYQSLVHTYLQGENNHTYSIGGLILSNSAAITANYWLNEVYDEEITKLHRQGDIHIHELSMLTPSYAMLSIATLMEKGLGGVKNKTTAGPAKHLNTLVEQMVNFLGILQNEWAGSQTFEHFDTYLAPFIKKDNLSYQAVKQSMQSFIYGSNISSRWGTQTPYVKVEFDTCIPDSFAHQKVIIGRQEMPFTFGECEEEMHMIQKAFIEVYEEGDYLHQPFRYPIVTMHLDNKKEYDKNMFYAFALQNKDITLDYGKDSTKTGSIGIVSLNMNRIAKNSHDETSFYQTLTKVIQVSLRSLATKRDVLNKLLESGLYPYTKHYIGTFDRAKSTIGIALDDLYENCDWVGERIKASFYHEVLAFIQNILNEKTKETGYMYEICVDGIHAGYRRFKKIDTSTYPTVIYDTKHAQIDFYDALDEWNEIYHGLPISFTIPCIVTAKSDVQTCQNLCGKIMDKYELTKIMFKMEV